MSQYKVSMVSAGGDVTFANSAEGDHEGPATFSALAYSGGMVPAYTATPRIDYDYVIDLSGTKASKKGYANLDHKPTQRVGHLTKVDNTGTSLHVDGVLSAATPYADQVANSVRLGMPWEVSIEGTLGGRQFIPKGQSAVVNGQKFEGPFYRFTKNTFTDIAFVSRGADGGNEVKIAASTAGETQMTDFDKFVVSCGHDPETVADDVKANLQSLYDLKSGGKPKHEPTSFVKAAEDVRRENQRQDQIQKMALEAMKNYPLYHDQIEKLATAALASETDPKDFELELLRGTRIQAGKFSSMDRAESDPNVIEAAVALAAGLPNIEKHYSEQVLNTVDRSGMRNFGLQQLLLRAANANGYVCRAGDRIHNGNIREILEYVFPPVHARLSSGFSGVDMSGILGAVANKEILAGYMEEDSTWREIATVKSVSNFQQYTSYRMLDSLEYEEVGAAGEIKHGTLAQESYTRQAKTYAKMLGITRTDIINDDLGAFDDIRARLGRGAAKKFNNIFWAAFINNSTFFTTALTNYTEGSTTNLGLDGIGLGLGVTAYRKMTTPSTDGTKRIGASVSRPTILLAPPELEVNARTLYASSNYVTGASATIASANIFQGLYRPVIQNRLSDSAFTGYSTTAWYLFGDEMKPMVVSFLNGQQTPTVESTDAEFNTLGIQFRGYHDFGADKSEYMSGVKVKGAA